MASRTASHAASHAVPVAAPSTDTTLDDLFDDTSDTVNPPAKDTTVNTATAPSTAPAAPSTAPALAPVAAPSSNRPGRKSVNPADVSGFDTGTENAGIIAFAAGADPLYATWYRISGDTVADGYKRLGQTDIAYSIGVTRSLSFVQETLLNMDPTAMSEEALEALAMAEQERQIAAVRQATAQRLAESRAKRAELLKKR